MKLVLTILLVYGVIAAAGQGTTIHVTFDGTVVATGPAADSSEMQQIQDMASEIGTMLGSSSWEQNLNTWLGNGGMIGRLTGGEAYDRGLKGIANDEVVLIRTDDHPTRSQLMARLFHEFQHAWHGGTLDDCQHAENWRMTYNLLAAFCEEGERTPCKALDHARDQYKAYSTNCDDPFPGAPPSDTNPPCCTP